MRRILIFLTVFFLLLTAASSVVFVAPRVTRAADPPEDDFAGNKEFYEGLLKMAEDITYKDYEVDRAKLIDFVERFEGQLLAGGFPPARAQKLSSASPEALRNFVVEILQAGNANLVDFVSLRREYELLEESFSLLNETLRDNDFSTKDCQIVQKEIDRLREIATTLQRQLVALKVELILWFRDAVGARRVFGFGVVTSRQRIALMFERPIKLLSEFLIKLDTSLQARLDIKTGKCPEEYSLIDPPNGPNVGGPGLEPGSDGLGFTSGGGALVITGGGGGSACPDELPRLSEELNGIRGQITVLEARYPSYLLPSEDIPASVIQQRVQEAEASNLQLDSLYAQERDLIQRITSIDPICGDRLSCDVTRVRLQGDIAVIQKALGLINNKLDGKYRLDTIGVPEDSPMVRSDLAKIAAKTAPADLWIADTARQQLHMLDRRAAYRATARQLRSRLTDLLVELDRLPCRVPSGGGSGGSGAGSGTGGTGGTGQPPPNLPGGPKLDPDVGGTSGGGFGFTSGASSNDPLALLRSLVSDVQQCMQREFSSQQSPNFDAICARNKCFIGSQEFINRLAEFQKTNPRIKFLLKNSQELFGPDAAAHYFVVVEVDGKSFLVDPTFIQFTNDAAGRFMNQTPQGRRYFNELTRPGGGVMEITDDFAQIYGDSLRATVLIGSDSRAIIGADGRPVVVAPDGKSIIDPRTGQHVVRNDGTPRIAPPAKSFTSATLIKPLIDEIEFGEVVACETSTASCAATPQEAEQQLDNLRQERAELLKKMDNMQAEQGGGRLSHDRETVKFMRDRLNKIAADTQKLKKCQLGQSASPGGNPSGAGVGTGGTKGIGTGTGGTGGAIEGTGGDVRTGEIVGKVPDGTPRLPPGVTVRSWCSLDDFYRNLPVDQRAVFDRAVQLANSGDPIAQREAFDILKRNFNFSAATPPSMLEKLGFNKNAIGGILGFAALHAVFNLASGASVGDVAIQAGADIGIGSALVAMGPFGGVLMAGAVGWRIGSSLDRFNQLAEGKDRQAIVHIAQQASKNGSFDAMFDDYLRRKSKDGTHSPYLQGFDPVPGATTLRDQYPYLYNEFVTMWVNDLLSRPDAVRARLAAEDFLKYANDPKAKERVIAHYGRKSNAAPTAQDFGNAILDLAALHRQRITFEQLRVSLQARALQEALMNVMPKTKFTALLGAQAFFDQLMNDSSEGVQALLRSALLRSLTQNGSGKPTAEDIAALQLIFDDILRFIKEKIPAIQQEASAAAARDCPTTIASISACPADAIATIVSRLNKLEALLR